MYQYLNRFEQFEVVSYKLLITLEDQTFQAEVKFNCQEDTEENRRLKAEELEAFLADQIANPYEVPPPYIEPES